MKPLVTVKRVVQCWEKGGIDAVTAFLNDASIYENTWSEKIQNLIKKGHTQSVEKEIELVAFNIDLRNKLYKPKKEKDNGDS